ncbi:hypothetical protein FACS1894161_2220 [Spirochaetia bacterium]|nr:hypothetical protein FACS1894161_2220 [Spirochaetia bacterium]
MMGRLIGFIIILAVILAFIGFNLDNRCDISLVFRTIPQVPVCLTALISFILGMLASVPFLISFAVRKKAPKERNTAVKQAEKPALSGEDPVD